MKTMLSVLAVLVLVVPVQASWQIGYTVPMPYYAQPPVVIQPSPYYPPVYYAPPVYQPYFVPAPGNFYLGWSWGHGYHYYHHR
jgi:hypothetical protein